MDTGNGNQDRGDGRVLTAALLVLTGATATAFGRLFEGGGTTLRLVAAAAAAVLIGALLRRGNLALSVGAAVAGLGVAVGVLVFPRTTMLGFLPTTETLDALMRALGNLGRRAALDTAPAQPVPALFAPSLIAVWAGAYASHALVVRAASPVLGLVPPAALLGFANVVAEDGARLGYAAAFLAGSLLVLFTSGVVRLRAWGPLLPPREGAVLQVAAAPAGRLARRLGAGAMLAAVLVPWVLPGFRAGAILDLRGVVGDHVSVSPLVDIQTSLLRNRPLELFSVDSDVGAYWRLEGLDEYTGRLWRSSDPSGREGITFVGASSLAAPHVNRAGRFVTQSIELHRLGGTVLPTASWPVDIATEGLSLRHDRDRGVLRLPGGIPEGPRFAYAVSSFIPAPTAGDLDRPFDFSGIDPRYSVLPDDTPPEVAAVAEELTVGARTPFRRALAIQNYLRAFTYDLQVAQGHGYDDIIEFLRIRRGYCQQFAATMAVLLRALGYPARVAVGFLPGELGQDGLYHVTTEQAHAWPEMFFPGYGWLAFEPTPTRHNATARYLQGGAGIPEFPGGPLRGEAAQTGGGSLIPGQVDAGDLARRFGELPGLEALEPVERSPAVSRWLRWLAVGGLLLLLLGAGIPSVKWLRRRRRLWTAGSPRELVLAAYEVLEDRALDLGLHRGPHETPGEYARRLQGTVEPSDGHLERLTELAVRAAYAPRVVSASEGTEAVRAAARLGTDLRRHCGRRRALLAALRPFPPD